MNLRLKLIASVFVCLISAMDVSDAVELVRCDGVYPHHLQGVCQDTDGNLYWSFTTTLVKTDSEGQVLKKLEVANHHGDLCYVDGRLFVASGRRQTWYGKYWKQWPQRVEEDDRIILRVDDSLYEQRLVPVKEGEIVLPVLQESWRKYGRGSEPTSTNRVDDELIWLFEIVDRV